MSLIEQLAHCYTGWMKWLQDFTRLQMREVNYREIDKEERQVEWAKTYLPPRISERLPTSSERSRWRTGFSGCTCGR